MTTRIDASSVAKGIDAKGKPQPAFFVLHPEPKMEDKRILLQGLAQLEMNFGYYMQLQGQLAQLKEAEKMYQAAKQNAGQLAAAFAELPDNQVKATLTGFQAQIADYEARKGPTITEVTQQAMTVYNTVLEVSERIQQARANLIADWNFADPYDPAKPLAKPGDDPKALDQLTERQQEFINRHINEILDNGNANNQA